MNMLIRSASRSATSAAQRGHRGDAGGQQLVGEPLVEVQAGRQRGPGPVGLDPRPGDGEPVGADAQALHQRHVLGPPVVVVARDIAGVPVPDGAWLAAEGVPDRLAAAVFADGALDLVSSGGHPPGESVREARHGKFAHPAIVAG
jgi:hypothetical protein